MHYFMFLIIVQITAQLDATSNNQNTLNGNEKFNQNKSNENLLLTAQIYSAIFKERRLDQHAMIKKMLKSTYDKNYKLLKIAYPSIQTVLVEQNATIMSANYKPLQGFPQEKQKLQSSVIYLLENCCLLAENLLHFPEISHRIFAKEKIYDWQAICNWCIGFVNSFPQIIDEPTAKLMDLLRQEVNEDYRDKDYHNPYYTKQSEISDTKAKSRKKLKKGPQLAGSRNEL